MSAIRILVPLAGSFEEIEAIVPVDVWRRAGFEVVTAGVEDGPVTASRQTRHLPDAWLDVVLSQDFDLIYLPGGRPGADTLAAHEELCARLIRQDAEGKWIAAICAAPLALDKAGLLKGRAFTCHPGAEAEITSGVSTKKAVEIFGKLVTGRAAGTAMELALAVVKLLAGPDKVAEVQKGLQCEPGLLP